MISGRREGMKYVIYFYGGENHENCKSIQFSSGYTDAFTAEQANEWNKKYRWVEGLLRRRIQLQDGCQLQSAASPRPISRNSSRTGIRMTTDIKDFIDQK